VRAKWQAALGHVLVDEYQDTNAVQYEVLKHLVGERAALHGRGRRRPERSTAGAAPTLDNLKKLPQDFPQLKVIKLEQNYRSTSAILRAANNVIGPNPKLYPKTLFSELGEGEPVRVVDADNEEHEAERMVARIQSLRETSQHKEWRDFAVLYRANHHGQALRKGAAPRQDPVQGVGWPELLRPRRDQGPVRLVPPVGQQQRRPGLPARHHQPKRGIGHQTLQSLGEFAGKYRLSLFEALFSTACRRPCRRAPSAACTSSAARERPGIPRPPHARRRSRARLPDWTG
jgi:ATP-dependent DNA helicase Rep